MATGQRDGSSGASGSKVQGNDVELLDSTMWLTVGRGERCPREEECAFQLMPSEPRGAPRASGDGPEQIRLSRCRHFHSTCGCMHKRGSMAGMHVQTAQLEKAHKHQRRHREKDGKHFPSSSGNGACEGPLQPGEDQEGNTPLPAHLSNSQQQQQHQQRRQDIRRLYRGPCTAGALPGGGLS
ncbi:unnamed protein product, partial [Discosporangium mesarthrocarpum]